MASESFTRSAGTSTISAQGAFEAIVETSDYEAAQRLIASLREKFA